VASSPTCALKFPTSLAALAMSLPLTLTFGLRAMALPMPLLRPFFEAARAMPPAAPAIAAPPATSGTFALLATLPTVWPAPPTAFLTASTFECLLDEPFELLLALAPLLELRGLLALLLLDFDLDFVDLGFDADLDFVFDFEAGFAVFEADDLLDFGFDLAFGFELDLGLV
jgi:hypothetical protein